MGTNDAVKMLYELIAIVRPHNLMEVKEIARTTGSLILKNGGTIRGIKNWGVWSLPKRTRKHQAQYNDGHYFIMRYDASSKIQDSLTLLCPRPRHLVSQPADALLDALARQGVARSYVPR